MVLFLDANFFIDIIEDRRSVSDLKLEGHTLVVSPLSIEILSHVYKYHVPDDRLDAFFSQAEIAEITHDTSRNALQGPTADFEANLQLHCAAAINSDIFLTKDKELLRMKFFGKVRIVPQVPET